MSRAQRAVVTISLSLAGLAPLGACGDDAVLGPGDDAGVDAPIDPGPEAGVDGATEQPTPPAVDAGPIRAAFGLDQRPLVVSCRAPARPPPLGPITLERVYPDLELGGAPIMMAQPPQDPTRWFAALLVSGDIVSFAAAGSPTSAAVVANVPALAGIPIATTGESGLLGFAFHPNFQQNGRVYVSWNSKDGPYEMRSRLGYITSSDGGETFTSYTNVLVFDQPGVYYHHGGGIAFGPDGYLYASFGDGGDPSNGQTRTTYFSKVLRIDADTVPPGESYGIPKDNPFVRGHQFLAEILKFESPREAQTEGMGQPFAHRFNAPRGLAIGHTSVHVRPHQRENSRRRDGRRSAARLSSVRTSSKDIRMFALVENPRASWLPASGTTAGFSTGWTFTSAGSVSHPALASTNAQTQSLRTRWTSANTGTAIGGLLSDTSVCWRGSAGDLGGFCFRARFSLSASAENTRAFVGLSKQSSNMCAGDPSGVAHTIGMGFDEADSEWFLILRDSTTSQKRPLPGGPGEAPPKRNRGF